jgi:tetratricopeptide (TPR) repeat protein
MLGELYEKDHRLPQALKVYQELIRLAPDDPEPYLDLAAIYLQQEKYEDAVKAYDRIEKLIGINEEVVRQKQQLYLKLNRLEAAIAEGKKLTEAYPDEPRYLILLAEIYNSNKRTDEAIPLIEKALLNGGGASAQLRLILSDLYRTKGQVQKADQELEAAFGNPELSADIKVQILADYVKSHNEEKSRNNALRLAAQIIKSHPESAKGHAVYGDLLMFSNQKAQAKDQYLRAVRLDNSIFEAWQQLVRLEAELGQTDSLRKHTDLALELFPNQSVFWYFNGFAHLASRDYIKAVDALEEGRRLSVGNQELLNDYNAMLGDAYNATGEYLKSDAAYQAVLAKDPDNAAVLNNYSYFLSLRGEKLDQARQMAARLVEKNPDNPTYLDTFAWVLYMLKDYQQARKYLEKAAKGSPNGTILEHYGDVLFQLGETEKALQVWQQAKQAGKASDKLDQKIAQKKLYE